jgi:hypothetical protein
MSRMTRSALDVMGISPSAGRVIMTLEDTAVPTRGVGRR